MDLFEEQNSAYHEALHNDILKQIEEAELREILEMERLEHLEKERLENLEKERLEKDKLEKDKILTKEELREARIKFYENKKK